VLGFYRGREPFFIIRGGGIKGFVALISVGIAILIWVTGCSKEEEKPPPMKRPKIVKPIIKPPPEVKKNRVPDKAPQPDPMSKKAPGVTSQEGGEGGGKPPESDVQEKVAKPGKGPGIYVVKKGDSLTSISGQENVYGNPLTWPILYRHNLDKLAGEKIEDGLPEKIIREGVRLKILTPEELRDNLGSSTSYPQQRPRKLLPRRSSLLKAGTSYTSPAPR
jgi:hypothetical protein